MIIQTSIGTACLEPNPFFKNIENSSVFYRVPPQTTIESNPLTNDDTGVRLDSGQSTLDYANAILGPLN